MLPLGPPPGNFSSFDLPVHTLSPDTLIRLSRRKDNQPYFGKSLDNRFADPKKRYGTCYFGLSLECCFAEIVLRDLVGKGGFQISRDAVRVHVLRFGGRPLKLADLTGPALRLLGGSAELSTLPPSPLPQLWSRAVFEHKAKVDGILYQSRLCPSQQGVAVFSRAKSKMTFTGATWLEEHPELKAVEAAFRVTYIN
jgi:hypothetical protein